MANRSKAKGDRAERDVRDWYLEHGYPNAKRTRAGYERDWGDVHPFGNANAVAQVKDCQSLRWPAWFHALGEQKRAAGAAVAWLVVKRPGMGDVGEWLAVMTVADHAALLAKLLEVKLLDTTWSGVRPPCDRCGAPLGYVLCEKCDHECTPVAP